MHSYNFGLTRMAEVLLSIFVHLISLRNADLGQCVIPLDQINTKRN